MQEYNSLDLHIHQLSQTIAKFNRTFAAPKDDDSHTNLAFDSVGMQLLGRWVDSPNGSLLMALSFTESKFHVFDNTWTSLFSMAIDGKTQTEIETEIENHLPQLGLSKNNFTQALHFKIPVYNFLDKPFSAFKSEQISEWAEKRAMANFACQALLDHLQISGEIRIWPHHFDTGIYIEPTAKIGLGFGLAMKDSILNEPYFYFSAYGKNGNTIDYAEFKSFQYGKWERGKNWKGAVLNLTNSNLELVKHFINQVTAQYLPYF